ncbi:MAG: hypothetical protein A2V77_07335 [Anaeromyxobacter sp. RBG_16_69_14]|nr:MAG: hypothetical protein A2V77_07335 [Anaeromyxobacter sp. RBG_16_69_14]
MHRRLALVAVCALTLVPVALRGLAARPLRSRDCAPDGRGIAPRHWIGCAADEGPRRDLTGGERLLAGVLIDVNTATPEDLAAVPGLSARLAVSVVAERIRKGPFKSLDDLIRVRGIGPTRLARARQYLAIKP